MAADDPFLSLLCLDLIMLSCRANSSLRKLRTTLLSTAPTNAPDILYVAYIHSITKTTRAIEKGMRLTSKVADWEVITP